MPRAHHRPWLVVTGSLLLATACTPTPEELLVDPVGLDFEVGFLVEVKDESIERLSAPFGRAPDGFGQPSLQGLDREHSLYLVSVDLETLREAVPGYDPTRASEVAITSLTTTRLQDDVDPASIVLPAQTAVHRVDLSGATLQPVSMDDVPGLGSLALVVPTDILYCERTLNPMSPFGARSHLLSPPSFEWPTSEQEGFHRIRDLIPVSPDRVFGNTNELVFDLRQGEEVSAPDSSEAPRTHHISGLGIPGIGFDAMAVNPSGDALWVSGASGRDWGFLARFDVEPGGLRLAQVYTQDDTGARLPFLRDVHVDAQGHVLAGGAPRVLVLRSAGSDDFAQVILPPIDRVDESDDNIQFIKGTGDPSQPHLIGLKGDAVFVGDAQTGRFRLEYVQPVANRPLGVSPFLEEGVVTSSSERWAVGRGGIFSRWNPVGGWVDQALEETHNADGCTLGASLNGSTVHYLSVAVDEAHVFLAGDRCNAVFAQDRASGCTAVLTLPDEELARVDEESVRVLRLGHDRLWIGGELGRLYTIDRR